MQRLRGETVKRKTGVPWWIMLPAGQPHKAGRGPDRAWERAAVWRMLLAAVWNKEDE